MKNSFTTTTQATDIVQNNALSKVFLLVPLADAKNGKAGGQDGYSYTADFVRCCDKAEALCSLSKNAKSALGKQRKKLEQLNDARETASIKLEDADALSRTSVYCASCLDELKAVCSGVPIYAETVAGERSRRVGRLSLALQDGYP